MIKLYEKKKAAVTSRSTYRLFSWKWSAFWRRYDRLIKPLKTGWKVCSHPVSKLKLFEKKKGGTGESEALLGLLAGPDVGWAAAQRQATKVLAQIAFEYQGQVPLPPAVTLFLDPEQAKPASRWICSKT